jgi:signal peptidase I
MTANFATRALLCMIMFRSAVADWNVVPTDSMQPAIKIGDHILVGKLAYVVGLPLIHISLLHLADPHAFRIHDPAEAAQCADFLTVVHRDAGARSCARSASRSSARKLTMYGWLLGAK